MSKDAMLPAVRPLGWTTHLFVVLGGWFFLFWLIPYYDGLPGAQLGLDAPNEKTRVLAMVSLGLYGELHINRARAMWWTRETDLSGRRSTKADGPKAPHMLYYPAKTPGLPLMLGGMYWLYRQYIATDPPTLYEATYFARLFGTLIPVWLTSLVFYLLLLQICRSPYTIIMGYFVFLMGNMTLPYALTVSSHSFANGMLLVTFATLWWCPRNIWLRMGSAFLGGICVGLAFGAEYTAVLTGFWVGVMALFRTPPLPARYASQPLPQGWRAARFWLVSRWHLMFALVGSLLPVAAVLWYHKAAFGSYFKTNYHFMRHEAFRSAMESRGFLGYSWPPDWGAVMGGLFAPAYGMFFWTPFLFLAVFGAYGLYKRRLWYLLLPFLCCAVWWMMYAGIMHNPRGGWSVGPRYAANLVPFAMLLAVWGAERLIRLYGNRVVPFIAFAAIWSLLHYTPASVFFPHLPTSSILPQVDIVGLMIRRGLGPSSLLSLSPGWSMAIYALAFFALCGYIAIAGFQKRRWPGVTFTLLLVSLGWLIMVQLPAEDYSMRERRLKFIESLIPPDYRWH